MGLLRWRCAGSEDFAIFNAVKRTAFGDLLVKLIESCTKQISLAGQAIFKLFYRAGQVLFTNSLSAVLNAGDDAQTFLLGTTVVNPESFSLEVTSAHGDTPSRAEFSEVTFDGALATVAVPEPSSVIVGFFAVSLVSCRRRRKLDA